MRTQARAASIVMLFFFKEFYEVLFKNKEPKCLLFTLESKTICLRTPSTSPTRPGCCPHHEGPIPTQGIRHEVTSKVTEAGFWEGRGGLF